MALTSTTEVRIRLIEAIAPILIAKTTNNASTIEKWSTEMTKAMEQMFKAAEHLVLPAGD